jgi:hypothetical protein
MDTKNVTRGVAIGLLVLIGMLVAVSGAALAQPSTSGGETTTQLEATPPSERIRPLSGLKNIQLSVEYCNQEGGYAFVTTPITLQVDNSPSWISATVSPSTVYIEPSQNGGCQSTNTNVVVQTTSNAPAFRQGNIKISAQAESNGDLDGSSGETTIPVQAGFYSVVDARTPKTVVIAGPQEKIEFPIKIANFGNGPQTVFLDTSQQTEGLDIVLPGAVQVSSKATGAEDNTRTAVVSVQTPSKNGYINQPGTFTLDVSSAYSLKQSINGMSTRVSSLITTKGFFVPGPGSAAAVLAMAGVAMGLARRRER